MDEKYLKQKLVVKVQEQEAKEEKKQSLGRRVWEEKKKLWVVAGPAVFSRFSTFGISVISQAFMGHIGPTELAGFALVFTVIVRFANGVQLGMSSALETLCGQSYGAKQHQMLGIYLQRSWLVLLPCTILLLPAFLFTTPILLSLGQEEGVAAMAGTISLWFIPALFAYTMSFTLQMYLQSQSKNSVITYWAAISLSFHVFFCWLTTMKLRLGVPGVMVSSIFALWIPVFGQIMFVFCGGCSDTWTGFSFLAFKDLWPIVKLSLSSGVMICLEVWYHSVLVLLTGNIKDSETAIDALAICLNVSAWELMIAAGLMAAIGVRVANELGAGSAKGAKFAIYVVVATTLAIGTTLFVVFLVLRGNTAYVFTESPKVVRAVADLSPLLAFTILLNSVQPVLSGVAIGAGWQKVIAYVNITCYYLVGIPLGVVLCYLCDLGVKGVWIGMLFGVAAQTFVLVCFTWKTDWDKQVIITQQRIGKWLVVKYEEASTSMEPSSC